MTISMIAQISDHSQHYTRDNKKHKLKNKLDSSRIVYCPITQVVDVLKTQAQAI